jgi:hypothetical protein
MQREELAHELVPVPRLGRVDPALDRLLAMQRNEAREARGQRVVIGEEMRVFVLQAARSAAPAAARRGCTRGPHGGKQSVGQLHGADLPALRLDVDGTRRVEAFERRQRSLSNDFCVGCG